MHPLVEKPHLPCMVVALPSCRMAELLQSGQGSAGASANTANALNALLKKSKKPSVSACACFHIFLCSCGVGEVFTHFHMVSSHLHL